MSKPTQVTTGKVRFSYVSVFKPKLMPGGDQEKYSVTLLIPKADRKTLQKIDKAIEAAKKEYLAKNPGKHLPANLATTLHDGDEPKASGDDYGPECAGCMVINVTSKADRRPVVVYADKTPMTEESELYSGCYGQAVINFYVYNVLGKIGVSAGLNGIRKLEDGEPLAGGVVTDDDWDDDWDDSAAGGLLD